MLSMNDDQYIMLTKRINATYYLNHFLLLKKVDILV